MKLTASLLILATICGISSAAKILGVFPMAAPSHYFLGHALLKGLAEAGHDVTMISPFQNDKPPSKGSYRDIYLKDLYDEQIKAIGSMNLLKHQGNMLYMIYNFLVIRTAKTTDEFLAHPKVQALIKSNEKFDVVVVPQFMNDAMKGLAYHFNAHQVVFSNTGANSWISDLAGSPLPPSYIPAVLTNFSSNMNFFQRLINTLFNFGMDIINNCFAHPIQEEIMKRHIPNVPSLKEVKANASLILINAHESLFYPTPSVPQMVNIGGFHVKPPKKLPKDLQDYLDNSPNGVVYFSMGSNLKSVTLPEETRNIFLNAFAKLKQNVLWKWEDDNLLNKPKNVKIMKWVPQQDVLAHPNVKLFVTHGGMLSTIETVYHGKPTVAIPVMGDQKNNANIARNSGYAVVLPFGELTAEKFEASLEEALSNPKYAENAKLRSKIFHDRQVSPLDTAVYWVEYIIRHNGAPHLRVAGKDLPWYKYHLIDVFAFIALVLIVLTVIVIKICKCICKCIKNCVCKSKTPVDKKGQKKVKKQ